MGSFKDLSLGKKIGLGIASLFVVGAVGSSAQKSQTPLTATNQNVGQASAVDVSKQQPIETTEVKNESKTEFVPFESTTQNDSSLASGKTKVSTVGVNGERTIMYKVTYKDDKEVKREQVSDAITKQPISEVTTVGTKQAVASSCDPNYSGCVPIASDVDCTGGSGNGPAYVAGPINVIGTDIYKLDSDYDGIACE